jgi:hypothetical protein
MAFAAENNARRLDQPSPEGTQPLDPVFSDADDGQPSLRYGIVTTGQISGSHEKTGPDIGRYNGGQTVV